MNRGTAMVDDVAMAKGGVESREDSRLEMPLQHLGGVQTLDSKCQTYLPQGLVFWTFLALIRKFAFSGLGIIEE